MTSKINPECGTCDHWRFRAGDGGECWRYPPTLLSETNANGDQQVIAHRPWMERRELCGEWALRGTILRRAEKARGQ